MQIAEQALDELRKEVDAIIVIPNDRLLSNISKETSVENAFAMCDDVLKQSVEGISDLITTPGTINIDFADIKAVLKDSGSALMGVGIANGEKRAEEAAKMAINSPLLDISINGARGVLFSIAGGDDLTMFEIQEAAKIITESMDPDAKVIFGTVKDDKLKKGDIKVTIVASGFPEGAPKKSLFGTAKEEEVEEKKEEKHGIFGSKSESKKVEVENDNKKDDDKNTKKVEVKKTDEIVPDDDDDDEWGAVPAFLRRSKIK
jgi:cell division protein FtsZ